MVRNRLYTSLVNSIPIIPFVAVVLLNLLLESVTALSSGWIFTINACVTILLLTLGIIVTRSIFISHARMAVEDGLARPCQVQSKEFIEPKSFLHYIVTLIILVLFISEYTHNIISLEFIDPDISWILGVIGLYWTGSIISNPFLEVIGYDIYVLKTKDMSLDNATVISKNLNVGGSGLQVYLARFESSYFIETINKDDKEHENE